MKRLALFRFGESMEDATHIFVTVRGHPWRMKRLAFVTVRGANGRWDTLLSCGSASSVDNETPCFVTVRGADVGWDALVEVVA